mmetsp:Transcript_3172/g.7658  ORF Transcript_3172/g.7658 Transcript_3172/m.7658 type:complete len:212 (-) Transcript_3172:144-779(-)
MSASPSSPSMAQCPLAQLEATRLPCAPRSHRITGFTSPSTTPSSRAPRSTSPSIHRRKSSHSALLLLASSLTTGGPTMPSTLTNPTKDLSWRLSRLTTTRGSRGHTSGTRLFGRTSKSQRGVSASSTPLHASRSTAVRVASTSLPTRARSDSGTSLCLGMKTIPFTLSPPPNIQTMRSCLVLYRQAPCRPVAMPTSSSLWSKNQGFRSAPV